MNLLTKLTLRGYKTFQALEAFEPRGLNVLIGANGAGKSNFISFFRLLRLALASSGDLQRQVALHGGAHRILHDGQGVTTAVEASLAFRTERGDYTYEVHLDYAPGDTLIFGDERYRFTATGRKKTAAWTRLGGGHRESALIERAEAGDATAKALRGLLEGCVLFQFHNTSSTSRMRGKWRASDDRDLKEDAANLAAVLLRLRAHESACYRRMVATLRLIVPFFDDFVLAPDHGDVLLCWREVGSDVVFDAAQASDGMLRTFALVALLALPESALPKLVILDEPELGLHPYAISVVGGMIKRVAALVQVMVATQSATLVDQFAPEDMVVVERRGRTSSLRRLDPEALAAWLEEYSLGELWLKNVLGGRPGR